MAIALHEVRFIATEYGIDTADADGAKILDVWATVLSFDAKEWARQRAKCRSSMRRRVG
jgi:hypothetical protein